MPHCSRKNFGFTLVELLVSIAVVSIIFTIVVSNQSTYTDQAILTNVADEISATISQAQAYGIGVKELSPGSNEFSASYGLIFSLLGSGSNTGYLYFADRNGNEIYDGDWSCPIGGISECLEKVTIPNNDYIESLCAVRTAGADLCIVGRVDISFDRPSTEARLQLFDNGGQSFHPAGTVGVRIILRSLKGLTRSVVMYETGQISVQ